MNIEHARTIAKEKIEALAAELQRGASDTLKEYLAAMARFPNYSARNVLLIHSQVPQAERVCSYGAWKRLGRFVKQGERGIVILAPTVFRRKPVTSDRTPDSPDNSVMDETPVGFRPVYVWAQSQTDGAPLPEPATVRGDPGVYLERLKAFVAQQGIRISYTDRIAPARGVSCGSEILLLPHMTPADEFSTLVHETTHATLHQQEDRKLLPQRVLEVEAEASAYVVCQAINLDTNTSSSDYLSTYPGADAKTLAASLDRIQRTAAEIITAIGPDV